MASGFGTRPDCGGWRPTATQIMNDDTRHTVSETADKIVLKTDVKRGSGTRDQDKINVKVKGSQPDGVAHKLKMTLDALEANGIAETLRNTQPEDTDE